MIRGLSARDATIRPAGGGRRAAAPIAAAGRRADRRRRGRGGLALAAAALTGLALPPPAAGHEIEETHVLVRVLPGGAFEVDVRNDADWLWQTLHPGVSARPAVNDRNARLAALAPAVAARVTVRVDEVPVPPDALTVTYLPPAGSAPAGLTGQAEPGVLRLAGRAPPGARTIRIAYDLVVDPFPLTVTPAVGPPVTRWLFPGQTSAPFAIADLQPPTRTQVAAQYLGLGFTHILPKGLDHILFVLGLFLLSPRPGPLLRQVTAFTAAHTLTLGLTVHGAAALPPGVVEPLIALSIVWVAVENLATSALRLRRVAVVFAFGLLHGMGFAGVLTGLGLPRTELITALVAFNLGVEGGQIAVIAAAAAAVVGVRRRTWYRRRVVIPASAGIAATGVWWTVARAAAG